MKLMFSDELQMCSGHRDDAGCAVLHAIMTGVAGQISDSSCMVYGYMRECLNAPWLFVS